MHYKTIVLELIQQQPELHEQLRASRALLSTMEAYALELKAGHEEWVELLSQKRPGSDRSQIAAEAMELAIQDLRDRLPCALPGTKRSLCPWTRRWASSADTRRPRKGVTRPAPAADVRPPADGHRPSRFPRRSPLSYGSGPARAFLRDITAAAGPLQAGTGAPSPLPACTDRKLPACRRWIAPAKGPGCRGLSREQENASWRKPRPPQPSPTSPGARKPRHATSSPPSARYGGSRRKAGKRRPASRRRPALPVSGRWPCRSFPTPSPDATRTPAGRRWAMS